MKYLEQIKWLVENKSPSEVATNWNTLLRRQSARAHVRGVYVYVRTRTYVEFTRDRNAPTCLTGKLYFTAFLDISNCQLVLQSFAFCTRSCSGVSCCLSVLHVFDCKPQSATWRRAFTTAAVCCWLSQGIVTSDVSLTIPASYTGDHVTRLVQSHIAMCIRTSLLVEFPYFADADARRQVMCMTLNECPGMKHHRTSSPMFKINSSGRTNIICAFS